MKNIRERHNIRKKRSNRSNKSKKVKPYLLRILGEWNEWEEIPDVQVNFPKGSAKLDLFDVIISTKNGYWTYGNLLS